MDELAVLRAIYLLGSGSCWDVEFCFLVLAISHLDKQDK